MASRKDCTNELKPVYRKLIEQVWKDDTNMVDYCMRKVEVLSQLDNGIIFFIEKQKIEKNFCFGYSDSAYDTEDYDRANAMAFHARTSEQYFTEQK